MKKLSTDLNKNLKGGLSELQKGLIGGLQLLQMKKDNIIMVMLMLKSYNQQMKMCLWLSKNFKQGIMPTQTEVMYKAKELMGLRREDLEGEKTKLEE